MSTPVLLVMAGGTGGHIFPALAVAQELAASGWRIVWLGQRNGMEARIVPEHGLEMAWIDARPLRGRSLRETMLVPWRLLIAIAQAIRVFRRVQPSVVLGMGGYVSAPGGLVAAALRRPLVLHEQNSVAGLANRLLARLASRIYCGFPDVLPGAQWVGNPVRRDIAALPPPAERYRARSGPLKLLVLGGSQGARALNDAVPGALARLPQSMRPEMLHQTGASDVDAVRKRYADLAIKAEVCVFIADMAAGYRVADLVICRAGALTIAELAAAGVASILVPYPHAVDDHQTGNARFLAEHGAAILLPQLPADDRPESSLEARLATWLMELLIEPARARLAAMADAARRLARPDAAAAVAAGCRALVEAQ